MALAVTAFAALVQGTVGVGYAVVSVPVLSLVDPDLTPVPQLLLAAPLAVAVAYREREHLDLSGAGWVIAGRFPGVVIGIALLKSFSETTLDALIGLIVLGAVLIIGGGLSVRRSPATEFGVGVASGTSGLVASIGGPPIALLYHDAPGGTARSSMALIFTIGIAINITARAVTREITGDDLAVAAVLFPAMLVGLWASQFFLGWAEGTVLRRGILAVSAVAAVALLVKTIA